MKQVLPDGYSDYSPQEILDLHSDLKGKTDLEAKYQYVKLARSLPTFGVHFFVVRVSLFHLDESQVDMLMMLIDIYVGTCKYEISSTSSWSYQGFHFKTGL